MQSFVKKAWVAGIILLIAAAPVLAQGQNAEGQIVLFKGSAINDSVAGGEAVNGVIAGSWGAGTCEQVSDPAYGDTSGSLKVTTEGYYEGARLDFHPSVDLASAFKTQFTFLRFAVKFPPSADAQGYTPTMLPDGTTAAPPMQALIRYVRVVLYLDNGDILATTPQIVDISKGGIKGWAWMSVPLASFKSVKNGSKITGQIRVKRMTLAGNTKDSFNIGEIRTEVDDENISASAGDDQVVAQYDLVVFQGSGESKVSPLKYSWDYGDGSPEDTTGPLVAHRYRKGGTYTATLTVSDSMGLKPPAKSTCSIEVNE